MVLPRIARNKTPQGLILRITPYGIAPLSSRSGDIAHKITFISCGICIMIGILAEPYTKAKKMNKWQIIQKSIISIQLKIEQEVYN